MTGPPLLCVEMLGMPVLPCAISFPSIISRKKEWEHSHTKNGGGVRCSSSLRQDRQAIYSSRECKQTCPCPTVPAGCPLPTLAPGHLVPARGQPPACAVPTSAQKAQLQQRQVATGWGPSPRCLSPPWETHWLQGDDSDPSPALRT